MNASSQHIRKKAFLVSGTIIACAVSSYLGLLFANRTSVRRPLETLVVVGETNQYHNILDRNAEIEAVFELKNIGNKDLHILGIGSDCSCANSVFTNTLLSPGERKKITLKFTGFTENAISFQRKAVIKSSDNNIVVGIHGELPPSNKILFRPNKIIFDRSGDDIKESLVLVPKHCYSRLNLNADRNLIIINSEILPILDDFYVRVRMTFQLNKMGGMLPNGEYQINVPIVTGCQEESVSITIR